MEEEKFVRLSEFAAYFRISKMTAMRWIRDGKIKAKKIGSRWKIPMSEVRRIEK